MTWHLIAKQLDWDVDVSTPTTATATAVNTISIARQLAELYQQLLHPFEMVWEKALSKQQAQLREKERDAATARNNALTPSNGRGIGAGWPQNQGGLNGNVQGVGGVGGASGTAMSPQQMMSLGLSPAPQTIDLTQRSPLLQATSTPGLQAQQNGAIASLNPNKAGAVAGPSNPLVASSLRPGTTAPTPEQILEARSIVEELRRMVDSGRRAYFSPAQQYRPELTCPSIL